MVDKKSDPAPAAPNVVQRYRFRVRTSDGRELISNVGTVSRAAPAPQAEAGPQETAPQIAPAELQTARALQVQPQAAVIRQQQAPQVLLPMVDVSVKRILVSVKGSVQGNFAADGQRGFADQAGKAKVHQFEADDVTFAVSADIDLSSGQPAARRMYVPLSLLKATGPASIQFQQAAANNESLSEVILDCFGDDAAGKQVLAASVKLSSARVASIDFAMPNVRDLGAAPRGERIALVFEQIEIDQKAGSFSDGWS